MLLLFLACTGPPKPAAVDDTAPAGCEGPDDDLDGVPLCDNPALTDCDDADATNWPGNSERCNDHDDDCDGLIDAADPDGVGMVDQYTDADGDHWGSTFFLNDCPPLSEAGVAFSPGDCDDADATINPEATEMCDGVDNDCDEVLDPDSCE